MSERIVILLSLVLLVLIGLAVSGCKDWEYNIEKNGILFKKIHQSEGGTRVGFMTGNHTIQGFPCEKGWIHFRDNWDLLSFQLSKAVTYKNMVLPAHTWIHFPYHQDRTGYVCSFPHDYEVRGFLCGGSGGYKGTHTGFYDSGKLRSFFPPQDVRIDGVPCRASLLANVNLHENGRIKSCKLAADYRFDGKAYKKGETIRLDQ